MFLYIWQLILEMMLTKLCGENGTTYIDQNGEYGIGVIKGKARDGIKSKYIGFESRKRYREEMIKSIEEEISAVKADILSIDDEINTKKLRMQKLDIEAYIYAYEGVEEYNVGLQEIEISYNKYVSMISNEEMLMQQKQDIEYDIDSLKYEISVLDNKIQNSVKKIEMLKETLKKLGIEEIEKELELCIRRLDEIPDEIKDKSAEKAKLEERIERNKRDLLNLQDKINLKLDVYNIAKEGLKKEISLGFVKEDVETDDILKSSRIIVSEYRMAFDKAGFDREKFTEKLQNVYYECRNELLEYGLSIGYIFDEDTDNEQLKEIRRQQKRLQITASISGKIVSLYTLYSDIEDDIKANESLLRDTDRHLFEEIIMHNVGIKIRAKIFKAEEWVKKAKRNGFLFLHRRLHAIRTVLTKIQSAAACLKMRYVQ